VAGALVGPPRGWDPRMLGRIVAHAEALSEACAAVGEYEYAAVHVQLGEEATSEGAAAEPPGQGADSEGGGSVWPCGGEVGVAAVAGAATRSGPWEVLQLGYAMDRPGLLVPLLEGFIHGR
jgi:hypothetical protein